MAPHPPYRNALVPDTEKTGNTMGVRGSMLKKILSRYMDANMKMSGSLEYGGEVTAGAAFSKLTEPARLARLPG